METAKIVREDYLHQNAFHDVDTFTSLNKQFLMLKLIRDFYDLSMTAIENYADLSDILNCSCKEKIGRAKYITEENLSDFDEIFKTMNAELKALAEGDNDEL